MLAQLYLNGESLIWHHIFVGIETDSRVCAKNLLEVRILNRGICVPEQRRRDRKQRRKNRIKNKDTDNTRLAP